MKNNRLLYILLPLFLVVVNFVLKGLFLGNNSLGGDEPFSVYHAQMTPDAIIHQLIKGNNPPFYEMTLHFWIKWFGISEFSVRFPSLIFSSITTFFIYKIALRAFNIRVAVYASIFFIFSTYHVVFAHEARAYALFGMFTAISMFCYLEIVVHKTASKWVKTALLAVNILLIYTHFFGFFVLFIQFFFIAFQPKLLRENYRFLLLSTAVILLFYAPYISILTTRFYTSAGQGTWVRPPEGIADLYDMFRRFANAPVGAALMILFLLTGMVMLGFKNKTNAEKLAARLIFAWFFFPLLFMFGISFWVPVFLDRYLMFVAIGGTLALGLAVDSIVSHPKGKFVIPAVMSIIFIATVKPNKSNNRLERDAVRKVMELKNMETLVIVAPDYFALNFAYYYDQKIFADYNEKDPYKNILADLRKENILCVNNLQTVDFTTFKKIIFLDAASNFANPNNGIYDSLNNHLMLSGKTHIEEIYDVYTFDKKIN